MEVIKVTVLAVPVTVETLTIMTVLVVTVTTYCGPRQVRNTLLPCDMSLEKHWRFRDLAFFRGRLHTWVLLPRTLPKFSTLCPPVPKLKDTGHYVHYLSPWNGPCTIVCYSKKCFHFHNHRSLLIYSEGPILMIRTHLKSTNILIWSLYHYMPKLKIKCSTSIFETQGNYWIIPAQLSCLFGNS